MPLRSCLPSIGGARTAAAALEVTPMTRSRSPRIGLWICLAGLAALATAGCSSGNGGSIALSTSGPPATNPAASTDDAGVTSDAGTIPDGGISLCDRLLVNRVRLVARRIDLERISSNADAGSDGGTDAGASDGGDAGTADAGVSCDCPDGGTVCARPGG